MSPYADMVARIVGWTVIGLGGIAAFGACVTWLAERIIRDLGIWALLKEFAVDYYRKRRGMDRVKSIDLKSKSGGASDD
jgi:hypothetical protein